MSGSPTHRTASWLAQILQPVREIYGTYSIKDSFEFADRIRDLNLKNSKMFSFAIASLFTSVPGKKRREEPNAALKAILYSLAFGGAPPSSGKITSFVTQASTGSFK